MQPVVIFMGGYMAKMKEGSKAYNYEAIQIALSRVSIAPCIDCGHPVERGYCCRNCGSGNGTSHSYYFGPRYTTQNNWAD